MDVSTWTPSASDISIRTPLRNYDYDDVVVPLGRIPNKSSPWDWARQIASHGRSSSLIPYRHRLPACPRRVVVKSDKHNLEQHHDRIKL